MDLKDVLAKYRFQGRLTKQLDRLSSLDQQALNEIVLWKVNRYVSFPPDLFKRLNEFRPGGANQGDRMTVRDVLKQLLRVDGIALPMASTVLRFINCDQFAIIDWRAYEVAYPCVDGRLYVVHGKRSPRQIEPQSQTYFDYLDRVQDLCKTSDGIPFYEMDRLLYQLSKEIDAGVARLQRSKVLSAGIQDEFKESALGQLLKAKFAWTDECIDRRVRARLKIRVTTS
jgi:hypothetical protein